MWCTVFSNPPPEETDVIRGKWDDCGRNEIAGDGARKGVEKEAEGLCSGLQARSHQGYNWKSNEMWNEIMTTSQKDRQTDDNKTLYQMTVPSPL